MVFVWELSTSIHGVFNFDCSVGYNASYDLTITVDAFDLNTL